MPIDLDDEDAFFAALSGKMKEQADAGLTIGPTNDDANDMQVPARMSITRRPRPDPLPEAVEYEKEPLGNVILCSIDLETDPFAPGLHPQPFAAGFAEDDGEYVEFWGPDCVADVFLYMIQRQQAAKLLEKRLVVYAHNGGKFDFHYFMQYLDDESRPFLIDKRMVKIVFAGIEFRDSYSLMPVPLRKLKSKKWSKLEIDINKLSPLLREANRTEILEYLRADCMTLLDMVRDYIERFGFKLTMASVALSQLRAFHGFADMTPEQDAEIRPFYKGGRVQCFETGIIIAPEGKRLGMVDRNSMYPSEMAMSEHPVSAMATRGKELTEHTDFAVIYATSRGALGAGEGIAFDFTPRTGKWFATGHEIRAGLETGTLDIHRVVKTYTFKHRTTFARFVDHFYTMRQEARTNGDLAGVEFYKLVLNSAYGKLAMNTSGYKDYLVNPPEQPLPLFQPGFNVWEDGRCIAGPDGWSIDSVAADWTVWSRPTRNAGQRFLNVATAASITGAARAALWRAINDSVRPIYCDTDSVICEAFNGPVHDSDLGAWKVEAEGDAVCVGGKKMYAFLTREPTPEKERVCIGGTDFYLVKKAHKGVQLTADQIVAICRGEKVTHTSVAPTFRLDGTVRFQKRTVKMTGGKSPQLDMFEEEVAA